MTKRPFVPEAILAEFQEEAKLQQAQDFIAKEMDRIRQVLKGQARREVVEIAPVETVPAEPEPEVFKSPLHEIVDRDPVLLSNLLYVDSYVQKFYIRFILKGEEE